MKIVKTGTDHAAKGAGGLARRCRFQISKDGVTALCPVRSPNGRKHVVQATTPTHQLVNAHVARGASPEQAAQAAQVQAAAASVKKVQRAVAKLHGGATAGASYVAGGAYIAGMFGDWYKTGLSAQLADAAV